MGTRADFDIDVDVGNVCAQAGVGCIGVSTNEAQRSGAEEQFRADKRSEILHGLSAN